jgi:hypothetical protein
METSARLQHQSTHRRTTAAEAMAEGRLPKEKIPQPRPLLSVMVGRVLTGVSS